MVHSDAASTAPAGRLRWRCEPLDLDVECTLSALEVMRGAAPPGHCRRLDTPLESGGILFGEWTANSIRVVGARPLECEHKSGASFQLSNKDELTILRSLALAREDVELGKFQPIGLYMSERGNFSVAVADIRIFHRYLPRTRHVGVILRVANPSPPRVDLFIRERGSVTYFCAQEASVPARPSPDNASLSFVQNNRTEARVTNTPAEPARIAAPQIRIVSAWPKELIGRRLATPLERADFFKPARQKALIASRWDLVAAVVLLGLCTSAIPDLPPRSNSVLSTNAPARVNALESQRATGGSPTVPLAVLSSTAPKSELPLVAEPALALTPAIGKETSLKLDKQQSRKHDGRAKRKAAQPVNRNRETRVFHLPPSTALNSRIRGELMDVPNIHISQSFPVAVLASAAPSGHPVIQAKPNWGRLIWTGDLQKNEFILFSANGSSRGVLNGRLPGFPIRVNVQPGEVVEGGIAILTNDPKRAGINEPSQARNGWDLLINKWVQKPIPELKVVEAPGPANDWGRIVLQNGDRNLSVVVVDWHLMDARNPGD